MGYWSPYEVLIQLNVHLLLVEREYKKWNKKCWLGFCDYLRNCEEIWSEPGEWDKEMSVLGK